MQISLAFAISFPFHELHMRSMQIYEKLIVHVQIEIDFSVSTSCVFGNILSLGAPEILSRI